MFNIETARHTHTQKKFSSYFGDITKGLCLQKAAVKSGVDITLGWAYKCRTCVYD